MPLTSTARDAFPACAYLWAFQSVLGMFFFPHSIGNNLMSKEMRKSQGNVLYKFIWVSNDMPSPNTTEATVSTRENRLDGLHRQTAEMVSFAQWLKPEVLCVFSHL